MNVDALTSGPPQQIVEPSAPALPSEKHLVAATLAVEKVRCAAEACLTLLRLNPNDPVAVDVLSQGHDALIDGWSSLNAFHEIRRCAGQA